MDFGNCTSLIHTGLGWLLGGLSILFFAFKAFVG
jgi:hypothetical protein